jgi:hypothetical protein
MPELTNFTGNTRADVDLDLSKAWGASSQIVTFNCFLKIRKESKISPEVVQVPLS